jgi:hypothetical protein
VGPAPPARNFHPFRTQFWPGAGECSHVLTPSLTPSHEDVGAPWRTEATTTSRRRNPSGRQRSAMNTVRPSLKPAGPGTLISTSRLNGRAAMNVASVTSLQDAVPPTCAGGT